MYYIGSAVKSVVDIYNQINSATLTGAIDIVVIKQEDGSYIGSPFHVRFGKLGVLRSREKVVEIAINDDEVDLHMKLGEAGEAFFVEEADKKESVPYNLATSPIPSISYLDKFRLEDLQETRNDSSDEINSNDQMNGHDELLPPFPHMVSDAIPIRKSNDITGNRESSKNLGLPRPISIQNNKHESIHDYPLSDMDSPISSPYSSSPSGLGDVEEMRYIVSDTEVDRQPRNEKLDEHDITWEWGMLPEGPELKRTPREMKSPTEKKKRIGSNKMKRKYEIEKVESPKNEGLLLAEVLAADKEVAELYLQRTGSSDDIDSGIGRESTPATGTTEVDDNEENKDETLNLLDEESDIFDIQMSLCGNLKDRRKAPDKFWDLLISYESFTENPMVLSDPKLVVKINESYYNWAVAAPCIMAHTVFSQRLGKGCMKRLKQQFMPKKRRGWFYWRTNEEQESSDEESFANNPDLDGLDPSSENEDYTSAQSDGEQPLPEFKKTLRLTSNQWASLNLKKGANKITFTVTTRYQGTASCHAHIYLWNHNDKIVISDIDGTITRSDVLGQIYPLVGKDWSQHGVTGLFSKIQQNGYHFMYLSARAIGQAQITRDFLKSVKQGKLTLPDGPVFLTPTSLLKAFKKEVIERKPEEFKISCMRDIQTLFPETVNPFWSGFGNRINDVYAYRAVGIPISRIFTINYKGEIKHELTNAFTSSYSKLIELVDQMFPPLELSKMIDSSQSEFTSFSFWRTPVINIPSLKETDDVENLEFP